MKKKKERSGAQNSAFIIRIRCTESHHSHRYPYIVIVKHIVRILHFIVSKSKYTVIYSLIIKIVAVYPLKFIKAPLFPPHFVAPACRVQVK